MKYDLFIINTFMLDLHNVPKSFIYLGLLLAGVKEVSIDPHKNLIKVKGSMDAKELPGYLKEKLKQSVEVVSATTAGKKDDEKDKDG